MVSPWRMVDVRVEARTVEQDASTRVNYLDSPA